MNTRSTGYERCGKQNKKAKSSALWKKTSARSLPEVTEAVRMAQKG